MANLIKCSVYDINDCPFGSLKGTYSNISIKEAIKNSGYKNIKRDYTSKRGNIIVQCWYDRSYKSYVYFADKI